MASLVIATGEQAGTYYQISNRPLSAGRDPSRDIQIVDPKVSRRHFQIRRSGEDYVLAELKSLNGVYVNGEKIAGQCLLNDGDEIHVGDTTLIFYISDEPDKTNALLKYKLADRRLRDDRTVG